MLQKMQTSNARRLPDLVQAFTMFELPVGKQSVKKLTGKPTGFATKSVFFNKAKHEDHSADEESTI